MLDRPLVRRLAVVVLAALVPPVAASAESDVPWPANEQLLRRAREGAIRKLKQPGCLLLLEEFQDQSGRTLAANLAGWDLTAVDYLQTTPFLDGSLHSLCRNGRAAFVSVPGRRPVFVCPSFTREAETNRWVAENLVIHEMLHTLGLGENPPSSRYITARVGQRCR